MIDIKDKRNCCGCSACASVCPKDCITMTEDEEGFLYPWINKETCIDCGICEEVCPIIKSTSEDTPHFQEGFLLQHKDDAIRQQSTSGGAFTAIARWILRQGGVVFGAGYKKDTFIVEHQAVEREEDLSIFRSSKYVQSRIGNTYKEALSYLKAGRWVCFSGTPCQIAGLLGFLRDSTWEKLICVDLVCRGVPSPRILKLYIDAQQSLIGGGFRNILFRDKYYGYHYSSFSIYNTDTKKDYHKGVDSNAYLRAFFSNLSDRPSCYECRFKKRYRESDITIWDCFQVEKFTSRMDDKGTTRVLVQSEKGKMIMDAIKEDVRLLNVVPDKLVAGVREMFHSVPTNPKRMQFFNDSRNLPPVEFFRKWFPITWKVHCNAFIRLTCHRLGIYNVMKRLFMLVYVRRDERKR